jgi:hypothetical protein
VIRAALLVVLIRLGLWLLPFRMLCSLLDRWAWAGRGSRVAGRPSDAALAAHVARYVERISRYVPAASCLTQALAAQALLRRHGVAVRLRIGVVKAGPRRLMAHAWVEAGDRVILGATEPGLFTPLPLLKRDGG